MSRFERLRVKRSEIAKRDNVPPYVVFDNKTLEAIVRAVPRDALAFRSVAGIGEHKAAKYGAAFVALVVAAAAELGAGLQRAAAAPPIGSFSFGGDGGGAAGAPSVSTPAVSTVTLSGAVSASDDSAGGTGGWLKVG